MLMMYGIDPAEVREKIKAAAGAEKEINENYGARTEDNRKAWAVWLVQYKTLLAQKAMSDEERVIVMNKANPKFILRNYLLQQAIEEAEKGDYSGVEALLEQSRHPFDEKI